MKLTSSAAAASILFSASLSSARSVVRAAAPDPATLGASTVRITQVHNKNFVQYGRGPRAVAKAFQKYGAPLPKDLAAVLQAMAAQMAAGAPSNGVGGDSAPTTSGTNNSGGGGEVSAIPQMFDSEYLSAVQIGTPPQTVMLDFDTGSSDLWVFSSETPAAQKNGQKIYDTSASSTARKMSGASWSISYGDGSGSSGNVYKDVVSVGNVTVPNQVVETASKVSDSFTKDTASSGLLGLAFSNINQVRPQKQQTFFDNAISSLAMPVFSANLLRGKPGNYNFGFIDKNEFQGDLSYVKVNKTNGFWQFEANGYAVGNGAATSAPHQAIADTGTTLLLLPPAIVRAYYSQVRSARNSAAYGGYVFPCNTAMPSLSLNIGDYKAVVPGSLINFSPADTDSAATATTCFGGVQDATGLPLAIYGDIFLKAQYTLFDGGNMRLGFAPKSAAAQ